MKNVEKDQSELIEKIKEQTEQLWNTIQEAKKSNLNVYVGFDDSYAKPQIKVTEDMYYQG